MAKFQPRAQTEGNDDGLKEKMIAVNRVTKVVKGGRTLSFAALTVVGDGDGRIGMGKGKAKEVPVAVQKAMEAARRNMVKVSLKNGTIHHKRGRRARRVARADGAGQAGYRHHRRRPDARGLRGDGRDRHRRKSLGSTNPYNLVRATLDALKNTKHPGRDRRQARPDGRRDLRLSGPTGESTMTDKKSHGDRSSWCAASPARASRIAPPCAAWACASSTASRELEDTPAVRGMINKVSYLVKVL